MTAPRNVYEVLDEEGHKTGQLLDKAVIHQQQLWHEVVHVWIVNGRGELLMQLRAPTVELAPNVWDVSVGTHVRPQEMPPEAATRALRDAFGITVTDGELKHLFNIHASNPLPEGRTHNVFGHVFLLHADVDIDRLQVNPANISQLKWLPLNQLMLEIGSDAKVHYFPRDVSYYSKLFEAFQAWM